MDDEITGMFQIAKVLDQLDGSARARVIRWAADKYGVDLGQLDDPEHDVESADQTMFIGVDPAKVAAARAARDAAAADPSAADPGAAASGPAAEPASTPAAPEAPPPRDPERPSFLDTRFRMHSGKQHLKKAKEEKG
jgi:hypothetical protein